MPKVEIVKKYESRTELEEYKTDEQKKEEVGDQVFRSDTVAGIGEIFLKSFTAHQFRFVVMPMHSKLLSVKQIVMLVKVLPIRTTIY